MSQPTEPKFKHIHNNPITEHFAEDKGNQREICSR